MDQAAAECLHTLRSCASDPTSAKLEDICAARTIVATHTLSKSWSDKLAEEARVIYNTGLEQRIDDGGRLR